MLLRGLERLEVMLTHEALGRGEPGVPHWKASNRGKQRSQTGNLRSSGMTKGPHSMSQRWTFATFISCLSYNISSLCYFFSY